MKKIKSICALVLLSAGVLLFSGCGKSNSNSQNPTSNGKTPSPNPSVSIVNMAYSPATVYVTIGGTVTWTNKDGVTHTVTDVGGSFNSGDVPADQTYRMTFNKAGTYSYHCTIHPTMPTATVVVGN
ncbi:MAG: cupredoxin domain-containing protein [Bacteroidetes bacterium]|nr:cupredoxin domain-containing protein [Bacteroidota bacterium]